MKKLIIIGTIVLVTASCLIYRTNPSRQTPLDLSAVVKIVTPDGAPCISNGTVIAVNTGMQEGSMIVSPLIAIENLMGTKQQ